MLIENFSKLVSRKYKDDFNFDKFITENSDFKFEFEREDDSLTYDGELKASDYSEVLEYFEDISLNEALSKEELIEALKEKNEENKGKLLLDNISEIALISLYFCRKGIEYLELTQEGIIGLLKGIENYSVEKGDLKGYLRKWIAREISIYIEDRFLQLKAEFKYYLENTEKEELNLTDEEIDKKLDELDELMIEDVPFTVSDLEINILSLYFGFNKSKRFSMYEIEEELELGKDKGEEKFYGILIRLSTADGGMFLL
ncbi:MAG: sigma factor [Fusobacterium sp. JB021]|nr:sigma factor [Fusobacterium sp. JB020]MDP0492730.1 sigma factor [Fusobacterium sp. JB021]MDP0507131.1 sigma factor [Fusobacterium sp. JB019]